MTLAKSLTPDRLEQHKHFLALLIHDLRTPITTTKLTSELILNAVENLPAKEFESNNLNQILILLLRNIQRIENHFGELMALSKSDFPNLSLKSSPLDLNAVILDAIEESCPQLIKKTFDIQTSFVDIPLLHGDAEQLKKMFCYILNATLGRIDLADTISLQTELQKKGILISIMDNASPLGKNTIEKLMLELEQKQPHTRARINTYLAYLIAKEHGGRYWLNCEQTNNNAQYVWLPLNTND